MRGSSTVPRSATICSIPLPPRRCRRTIRRKTTGGCSTTQRPPASAWWAFVCWPVAHFPARASVIPSPARRRSRSARPSATTPILRVRGGSGRWSKKGCRKPVRRRHPLRHVPPGHGHDPGRHRLATAVRTRAGRRAARSVIAGRAGPCGNATAGVRRRGALSRAFPLAAPDGPQGMPARVRYSALILAAVMIGPHFAISVF